MITINLRSLKYQVKISRWRILPAPVFCTRLETAPAPVMNSTDFLLFGLFEFLTLDLFNLHTSVSTNSHSLDKHPKYLAAFYVKCRVYIISFVVNLLTCSTNLVTVSPRAVFKQTELIKIYRLVPSLNPIMLPNLLNSQRHKMVELYNHTMAFLAASFAPLSSQSRRASLVGAHIHTPANIIPFTSFNADCRSYHIGYTGQGELEEEYWKGDSSLQGLYSSIVERCSHLGPTESGAIQNMNELLLARRWNGFAAIGTEFKDEYRIDYIYMDVIDYASPMQACIQNIANPPRGEDFDGSKMRENVNVNREFGKWASFLVIVLIRVWANRGEYFGNNCGIYSPSEATVSASSSTNKC